MTKATRICKVCGCEYPYCKTDRRVDLFRWQDVACCPEHANVYFDSVAKARAVVEKSDEDIELEVPDFEDAMDDEPEDEEE